MSSQSLLSVKCLALSAALAACETDIGSQTDAQPDAAVEPDATSQVDASITGGDADAAQTDGGYVWNLPPNFPEPVVPADNPMSEAKVELGRRLFYDKRLSDNQTQSCASCHKQELAFTDGRATGLGSTGEAHPRGPMGLTNIAYAATLTWANNLIRDLEQQALGPLFGETPVELGLAGKEDELLARLRAEPTYQELFPAAFPDESEPFSIANVTRAIASFERTLLSGNAPYDRYRSGDDSAISESAKRGEKMFLSERFECFHCHGGFAFADSVKYVGSSAEEFFHNNALYNIDLQGGYPPDNQGLKGVTGKAADMGRFKAPTLRNIAVTAPYMHDGSITTLDGVLDHYAAGGRTISEGPYAGRGFDSPLKSQFMIGFNATAEERADLLAFLESLTDEEFLTNPKFADPWAETPSN